jgi:uncharacterized protein YbjT (DUF2867 family)
MILVTGAPGNIGSQVVKQLAAKGTEMRLFVHKPEKASALKGPGIQVAIGDLAKPKTVDAALSDVKRAFLLSPADPCQVEWQANFIEAAKRAGVRRIVRLSALGADLNAPIALARWHAQAEKLLEESGIAYTHLQPHYFMQNMLEFAPTIATQNAFYLPAKDGKIGLVDTRDIAAVAVAALTEDGHEGNTYQITGPEALTFDEIAEKLSNVLGKKVSYVDVPPEVARKGMIDTGMPEWFATDLVALFGTFSAGYGAIVTNTVADVAHKRPISFDQFAHDYIQAFEGS